MNVLNVSGCWTMFVQSHQKHQNGVNWCVSDVVIVHFEPFELKRQHIFNS